MRTNALRMLLVVLITLAPLTLAAAPVLRSGESVAVVENQEVQDDFYAVAGTVTVSGKVNGDLYAAGGTITANGEIEDDVVIAGGSVRIDGPVGGDVRIAGGELSIAGAVGGDVLVLGGVVRILSTAQIDGDLLFLAGEMTMDGDLRGSLSGQAETVRINGPVLGAVSVTSADTLELGDQAHVESTITYASAGDIVRTPGSVVIGDITKRELPPASATPLSGTLWVLAIFFASLLYAVLFRSKLERLLAHTIGKFGQHGLLGLGVFVATPIAVAALMVSVIGLPVGIALALLYLFLIIAAFSLCGLLIGACVSKYFEKNVSLSLKWTVVGTMAFVLVCYIPYVGGLLVAVLSLVVIGGATTLLYGWIRR